MEEVKEAKPVKEAIEEKSVIKTVKSLPVLDVSLIVSVIALILSFIAGILYFIIGWSTIHQISTYIISLNPQTAAVVNSVAGSITAMGALYLIIIWPITVFIGTFIVSAIAVLLYNYLAPMIGGIKLELE